MSGMSVDREEESCEQRCIFTTDRSLLHMAKLVLFSYTDIRHEPFTMDERIL
jgi:hypothetical protein